MSRPFKIRHWLIPAGWVFGNIVRLRRWLYARGVFKSFQPPIPVVCVGNIAVGGTGKTPHATYLVDLLSKKWNVAMLSRGYGRKTKGYILANTTPPEKLSAALIGDEPLLLHHRFPQLPLAVDGDRKEGVLNLLEYSPETEVVVMDDAYQHLSFTPTIKLILTEFHRPYFKDYPMPAGRLREFPEAVSAADMVLVTKVDVDNEEVNRKWWREKLCLKDSQPLFFTQYSYGQPEPVTESAEQESLEVSEVILLTGIARPQPMYDYLSVRYKVIRHLNFPDHHNYTNFEMDQIRHYLSQGSGSKCVLITTEKDWMRLQSSDLRKSVSLLPVFILPIQVDFLTEEEKLSFNNIIENYVRRTEDEN